MGVIKCQDCGGMVSDRAAACPHCGAPMVEDIPIAKAPAKPIDPTAEVCLSCHSVVHSEERARGPAWLGCVLMIGYIIPGIVYFIWRGATKQRVCPKCGATALVPATSHRASEILGGVGTSSSSLGSGDQCPSCMLPVVFPPGRRRARCAHCTTIVTKTESGQIVAED